MSARVICLSRAIWADEGAHCLAQVRVADLNGEFSVRRLAALNQMACANSPSARRAA